VSAGHGPRCQVQWLGMVPYREALRLQRLRREAVLAGRAPDTLWLLEHRAVITTGLRQVTDLPASLPGVDVVRTERGGLATWHGPGQLVGYLVVRLAAHGLAVREVIHGVEQGILDWLGERGVDARRRPRYRGVWVGQDKICAIGMHFQRGVSMHGFALNLTNELGGFSLITPCGIRDGGVTTMRRVCGTAPEPGEVAFEVGSTVLRAIGIRPVDRPHPWR